MLALAFWNSIEIISFPHVQFPGDDISQVKRDVHGATVDNRMRHFSGKKNAYTRRNFYRILQQQIDS